MLLRRLLSVGLILGSCAGILASSSFAESLQDPAKQTPPAAGGAQAPNPAPGKGPGPKAGQGRGGRGGGANAPQKPSDAAAPQGVPPAGNTPATPGAPGGAGDPSAAGAPDKAGAPGAASAPRSTGSDATTPQKPEAAAGTPADAPAPKPRELRTLVPTKWLLLAPTDRVGRRPFRPDAVFAKYLTFAGSAMPTVGESVTGETGEAQSWREVEAADGLITDDFGYAFATIEVPEGGTWLAVAHGAAGGFVNGVPFVGDAYGYGFGGVPVALKKGPNHVFLRGRRGETKFELREPASPVLLASWSGVQPDLLAGRDIEFDEFGAVLMLNATQETTRPMELVLSSPDGYFKPRKFPAAAMPPLSLRTAFFTLERASAPQPNEKPGSHVIELALSARAGKPFTKVALEIQVKDVTAARRATFDSLIEGSIQTFSILPPSDVGTRDAALVLSLHGASVEALGQAQSYSSKPGTWIVAPTNRRPFGFDWQDWGREDAYETLAAALRLTGADPTRVFLTGHSMGGHGTWHLGVTDPWRFGAIAPSAGWSSFDTYGGRPDGELAWLWRAADAASRTEDWLVNLRATPTYILHGEADENVLAKEAHDLEAALVAAGGKPLAHYQPGAGHWWDGDAAPGADCVDWPGIFELFRTTPSRVLAPEFEFTSPDPSVNASYGPFVLDQPVEYGAPSSLVGRWNAERGELAVTTRNVRRLRVDFSRIESVGVRVKQFVLDGQAVDVWNELRLASIGDPTWFVRETESWTQDSNRARVELAATWRAYSEDGTPRWDGEKNSETCGPFKRAFARHFALVYGTGGSPAETKALLERARADQQTWWYRANGTPAILTDVDFLADEARKDRPIRNVILYGNSQTNKAWSTLVPADAPIRVRPGALEIGAQRFTGTDLAAVFVLPRADTKRDRPPYLRDPGVDPSILNEVPAWPLVGVFADTGIAGIRLGYQLSPFSSGVGYPDYAVFSSEVSRSGDGGVLAAGWFDRHWRLQPGGFLRSVTTQAEGSR